MKISTLSILTSPSTELLHLAAYEDEYLRSGEDGSSILVEDPEPVGDCWSVISVDSTARICIPVCASVVEESVEFFLFCLRMDIGTLDEMKLNKHTTIDCQMIFPTNS